MFITPSNSQNSDLRTPPSNSQNSDLRTPTLRKHCRNDWPFRLLLGGVTLTRMRFIAPHHLVLKRKRKGEKRNERKNEKTTTFNWYRPPYKSWFTDVLMPPRLTPASDMIRPLLTPSREKSVDAIDNYVFHHQNLHSRLFSFLTSVCGSILSSWTSPTLVWKNPIRNSEFNETENMEQVDWP